MAVDQNLVPKELLRRVAPSSSAASSGDGDDHWSVKKVKLLCSFGGRIFPRPSDGTLRYVGGHTRIISLQKDVSFPEFNNKMAETLGGPAVAFKYQLPGEDLDALVSVSCPEDLVNMIEEYDKLAAAAPDGSSKLRAFLFSPAELASADPSAHFATVDDTLQRYLEAVNGVASAADVIDGIWRRDSGVSAASSTQTSDRGTAVGDAVDGGVNDGASPRFLCSNVDSVNNASRPVYVGGGNGPAILSPDVPPPPELRTPAQDQNLIAKEHPPVAPFVPTAYMESHQVQYLHPQPPAVPDGPQTVNLVPFMVHHYVPGVPIATVPPSQVDSSNPVQDKVESSLENPYGASVMQRNRSIKAPQPLSQLPPLPPACMQPQNPERYDLKQVPPIPQPQTLKLEDCLMCQKALPHAHSDTLLHDHAISGVSSFPEANPVFYSHHSENILKQQASLSTTEVEQNPENPSSADQLAGYVLPQFNESQWHGSVMPVVQNVDNLNHANLLLQRAIGLQGEAQASNGMAVGNHMQSSAGGPMQWQPQQQQHGLQMSQHPQYPVKQESFAHPLGFQDPLGRQQWQTLWPSQYTVKQEVVTDLTDASTVQNLNFVVGEYVTHNYVTKPSYDYIRPISEQMEMLHLNQPETSESINQQKPSRPHLGAPGDVIYENPHLVVGNGYNIGHPYGESATFSNGDVVHPGYLSDGNLVKPIEQLPSANVNVTHLHNPQVIEPNQAANVLGDHGPFSYNLGVGMGHPAAYENFRLPAGSSAIGLVRNDDTTWKDDAYHLQSRETLGHFPAPPSGYVALHLPHVTGPTEHMETFGEPLSSDSHFHDLDPHNVPSNMNLVHPRTIAAVKQSVALEDSVSNHLGMSKGSNIVAMLEEGNLHCMPDSVINDSCIDPTSLTKEVSDEEHIKKQLQAVAEDVAASVLQSDPSLTSGMACEAEKFHPDLSNEKGIDENNNNDSDRAVIDQKVEDINTDYLDKVRLGIQLADDMGHLQIIKNSDLEELRELGSGTFGTVYHGKWRGTDVAIKRINDRCFTGKQSEQERMRTDFWNEACKLAELHHPNVVAFYGIVLDGPGGCVSTVTEYMVNGSLRQALQKNDKTLDRRKRLLIAMDVAFGMEYLHGKNIIHFDLKSDNLLVNLRDPQRPICKVGDLGLSKVKCKTLISGGMRGTLPWMAPELLYGNDSLVSEKVDVYSFAIVMWELFTGEEPYSDLHYGAIIGGILSNSLRPPVPDSCDGDWRLLMEQCWSAEPSERPSFTEIADRLRLMAAALPHKGLVQAQK